MQNWAETAVPQEGHNRHGDAKIEHAETPQREERHDLRKAAAVRAGCTKLGGAAIQPQKANEDNEDDQHCILT